VARHLWRWPGPVVVARALQDLACRRQLAMAGNPRCVRSLGLRGFRLADSASHDELPPTAPVVVALWPGIPALCPCGLLFFPRPRVVHHSRVRLCRVHCKTWPPSLVGRPVSGSEWLGPHSLRGGGATAASLGVASAHAGLPRGVGARLRCVATWMHSACAPAWLKQPWPGCAVLARRYVAVYYITSPCMRLCFI